MASWSRRGRIVVGVDGSAAALEAVRYAAREALSSGAHLEIAHATPGIVRVGGSPGVGGAGEGLTSAQCRAIGMRILNGARKVAREVAGDTWEISTALLDGPPAAMLVAEAAQDAQLLVLGDQRPDERFFTGAVLVRVVETSRVPVVVVPEGRANAPTRGVVAVGVQHESGSEHLLRRALAVAQAREATLRVVHAWQLPSVYDDLVAARTGSVPTGRAGARIEAVLQRVRRDFPSVEVELRVIHGQPARMLREETRRADLLLLGRRHVGALEGHLGGTGRALLREAACPVEVVPLAAGAPARDVRRALDPELVG